MWTRLLSACLAVFLLGPLPAWSQAKPNIVVIMSDDVAPFDISAYHRGLGAVRTPNIDRIAAEGMLVSDYYSQLNCTAGRAAFLTGRYPIRTGLTSVGQPGSPVGFQAEDVTIAQLLKAQGYATAQFGKSHVGDRNEHLPIKDKWLKAAEKLSGGVLIDIKLAPLERTPESKGHFLWMKEKTWFGGPQGQVRA